MPSIRPPLRSIRTLAVPQSRRIIATGGLSGGGTLDGDVIISGAGGFGITGLTISSKSFQVLRASGAVVTIAGFLETGWTVMGVKCHNNGISLASISGYDCGTDDAPDAWGASIGTASGLITATTTLAAPRNILVPTDLILTARGAAFTGALGQDILVTAFYWKIDT